MFPPWLIDFLHQNPYPSLSFLPLRINLQDEEEVVFFYQAPKEDLEKLIGNVLVDFNFYEENRAYIMRLGFYPVTVTNIKTKGYSKILVEHDYPYVETEFFKNETHKKALNVLKNQDNFILFLYDKKTGYIKQKKIDFTSGKLMLQEFIKNTIKDN